MKQNYIGLVMVLPAGNAAGRMRALRALKAAGAGGLRDGFHVLPESASGARTVLESIKRDIDEDGGTAYLLPLVQLEGLDPKALFDRGEEYRALEAEIDEVSTQADASPLARSLKQLAKLRKRFEQIVSIDFFPGEAQRQIAQALEALDSRLAPGEPQSPASSPPPRAIEDFQGRTWATRRRPWIDRLACVWLIRRFIDPKARFLWLTVPADCPPHALSFDFDGATFTHTTRGVSFETLIESFGIDVDGLTAIARLVHYLDVGGIEPDDAKGIERVFAGLRAIYENDDVLSQAACAVFDGLLVAYQSGERA